MTYQAIICDWNGTLFKDFDEEGIVRALISDIAKSHLPWHPLRLIRLLRVKSELESLNTQKTRDLGSDWVMEIFRTYSEKIIRSIPMALVRRSVAKYAMRPEVQEKVLRSVLRPVCECHQAGIITGILSAGYEYGIQTILRSTGFGDCFDFFEANRLMETGGRATAFNLNIYKNKAEVLLRLLKERNLEAKQVVYMGDSLDDAGCFELVGYPIVSYLTEEALKKRFVLEHKAFIPKDETDLTNYLKSI
jgi:phosphoglycolate phosphatase-like HAD superfamily hydrolase